MLQWSKLLKRLKRLKLKLNLQKKRQRLPQSERKKKNQKHQRVATRRKIRRRNECG